ncbi:MAG: chemotaxis response regulator protein-glutamate methylesterase [Magnetococcales bacterium]|nr:chemotaxis response regulator protein-glutamate methylesterase [Magnetococcales bacterium]
MAGIVKVLIVDDVTAIRMALNNLISTQPDLTVIGQASDPFEAARIIKQTTPDVITLDLEMPRMHGLTFLNKLMDQHPIPVIACSTVFEDRTDLKSKASALGAVDIIALPKKDPSAFLQRSASEIIQKIRRAAGKTPRRSLLRPDAGTPQPKRSPDEVLPWPKSPQKIPKTDPIIVVGSSTGGTEALQIFLRRLPITLPGMVIVQHMPDDFTKLLSNQLNTISPLDVREARQGDTLRPGLALLAPGGQHTLIQRQGNRYFTTLKKGPTITRHRPSVDILFRSAAISAGANAVGVILTGMGDDGARCMAEMRQAGSYNIAQDEATCVVYGMPKEAVARGAVNRILPLDRIADEVVRACQMKNR